MTFVMKCRQSSASDGIHYGTVRELGLLAGVRHPNIQCLIDVLIEAKATMLIRDDAGKDLIAFMRDFKVSAVAGGSGFLTVNARNLTTQLLKGVEFCHTRSIICRDLRPANVYVDGAFRLRIAGFGVSRCFVLPIPRYSPQVRDKGSMPLYLAPE